MTVDDFLVDHLPSQTFEPPNFLFWVRTVIEAMELLGPETDTNLERFSNLLLDYYSGRDIDAEIVEDIRHAIVRLQGVDFWGDCTPLGLKYRCINAIAASRDQNLADLDYWQYGVVTAFQLIDLGHDKDHVLINLIRDNASKYRAELYEGNADR